MRYFKYRADKWLHSNLFSATELGEEHRIICDKYNTIIHTDFHTGGFFFPFKEFKNGSKGFCQIYFTSWLNKKPVTWQQHSESFKAHEKKKPTGMTCSTASNLEGSAWTGS